MGSPYWLTRRATDVPAADNWLTRAERQVLARLSIAPRREAWRLGRWTAKAAVGGALGLRPVELEIRAAADGAPEVWRADAGEQLPVSVSISHRAGRALAAVAHLPELVGCDVEVAEPRSEAFIREWLSHAEQRHVAGRSEAERSVLINAIWTAKEAAAKVRREGLRLDVRQAVVRLSELNSEDRWRPLTVQWYDTEKPTDGWWRAEPGWVMAITAEPAPGEPAALL